jgi:hypothetical protein
MTNNSARALLSTQTYIHLTTKLPSSQRARGSNNQLILLSDPPEQNSFASCTIAYYDLNLGPQVEKYSPLSPDPKKEANM